MTTTTHLPPARRETLAWLRDWGVGTDTSARIAAAWVGDGDLSVIADAVLMRADAIRGADLHDDDVIDALGTLAWDGLGIDDPTR